MDNEKKCRDTIKNAGVFECKFCHFVSSKESNYKKHLMTRKHKRIILDKKKCQKNADTMTYNCICGKVYKYHSGLCKHRKSCEIYTQYHEYHEECNSICIDISCSNTANNSNDQNQDIQSKNDHNLQLTNIITEVMNQNKEMLQNVMNENKELHEIIKQQQETFNKQMKEILPKVGNTIHQDNSVHNSNKYNLNIFLNDKCKDALDIKEFLQTLIIEVGDLEYTGQEGFVKGISNIFIRGLRELEITKRPIHCTDLKRDTLYIKDQGKWEKDKNEEKVSNAIDTVKQNTFSKIQQWVKLNPNCHDSHHPNSDTYLNLIRESIGGYDETLNKNVKKVIKKLANEVYLPSNDISSNSNDPNNTRI